MTICYVLSPRAHADLDAIWNYTESRWGIGQAETYARELWQHIKSIAVHPTLGRHAQKFVSATTNILLAPTSYSVA